MINADFTETLSTAADAYSREFGVPSGALLTIETYVAATGSPTGVWVLLRRNVLGVYVAYDMGDAEFTDPSAGTAAGVVNLSNMPGGSYQLMYDRTSGTGDAAGAVVRVEVMLAE